MRTASKAAIRASWVFASCAVAPNSQAIGIANIEIRMKELSSAFLRMVKKAGLKTQTPEEWKNARNCQPDGPQREVMQARLQRSRHRVNVKDNALRVSMSFFNNEEDLDKACVPSSASLPGSQLRLPEMTSDSAYRGGFK